MAFGIDNKFSPDIRLVADKATDTYEIYSRNNGEYRGKRTTPKTGFTRYKINGKEESIYTADFLKFDETDKKSKTLKTVQAALWVAAVVLYLAAYLMSAPLSGDSLVVIAFFVAMIFMLYLSYTMVVKLKSHDVMTIYAFEVSSYRMETAALFTAGFMTVELLLMGLSALAQYDFGAANITALALQLIGTLLAFLMYFVESKRVAIKVPNKCEIPEGAEKIA